MEKKKRLIDKVAQESKLEIPAYIYVINEGKLLMMPLCKETLVASDVHLKIRDERCSAWFHILNASREQ